MKRAVREAARRPPKPCSGVVTFVGFTCISAVVKARERGLVHFADTHGKFAVADAPGAAYMAVNRNIVRRVSEYQVAVFVAEQR